MMKWLLIVEKIMAALAAIFVFINREKERDSARKEVAADSLATLMEKTDEAQKIRDSGLPDNVLLHPATRAADGGVQTLPPHICAGCEGDGGVENFARCGGDKIAQRHLGEELSGGSGGKDEGGRSGTPLSSPLIGGRYNNTPSYQEGVEGGGTSFIKPKRAVSRVFIHCSASDVAAHDNVKTIDQWHRQRGWSEIGYHFYIDKSGVLHKGRDIEKIPAAQAGHNRGTIAVCLGGEKAFTAEQFATLERFCSAVDAVYQGRVTFHGHREVNYGKTCPNFDYRAVLGLDGEGFFRH